VRRRKQEFKSEDPYTKLGGVRRPGERHGQPLLSVSFRILFHSLLHASPNLVTFYFLCIWKSRVSLFSLCLRSSFISRILFTRSLLLYAHLLFFSSQRVHLQIFMWILFLDLILFCTILTLALIWSSAHFMYSTYIYTLYLRLNHLGKKKLWSCWWDIILLRL
jgi:hypothetical protein